MSGFGFIKTFDRYGDDAAPPVGVPAARGVWALRVTKFDAGAKIGSSPDNLRTLRALTHFRQKPAHGIEPFDVYVSGNVAFEYVTRASDYDIFDGALSPQSATDVGANQVVVGPDAPGAPNTGSPVLMGVVDPLGNIQRVKSGLAGQGIPQFTPTDSGGSPALAGQGTGISRGLVVAGVDAGQLLRQLLVDAKGRPLTGDPNRPSYVAAFVVFLAAATATPILALEAGAAKAVRLRRLRLWLHTAVQTVAGVVPFALGKTTAASAGGNVITPLAIDGNDGAFSGTVRGNNGALTTTPNSPTGLGYCVAFIPAAVSNVPLLIADWVFDGMLYKPLTILPGTGNGISLSQQGGAAGATGQLLAEVFFTEE